jgi:hypothetical protein
MRIRRIVAAAIVAALSSVAPAQEQPPAQPDGPSVVSLTASAQAKRDAGDMKGAVEDLTKALALAPRNASLLHERAMCRTKIGDAAGVVADQKLAAEISPKDYPVDVALWREAVETARAGGGSTRPDIGLIQAEVAEIRGKPFKSDVESDSQSPKEFGEQVDESIDKEMPKAKRDDVQAALHRLGLVPGDFDMRKEVTGALMSQAAAYYDPKRKKFFNLMSGMPPAMVEATAAHELVHALQDQYFDLEAWFAAHETPPASGVRDDDRTLALRCVVEGEATYVQTIWQMEHMMKMAPADAVKAVRMAVPIMAAMEVEDLVRAAKIQQKSAPAGSDMAKAIEEMDRIQPYVMAPLLAAYMNGANLVGTADEGPEGWAAVDKLYAAPPLTSEQCLHPAKYAKKRDLPTPISVPEVPEIAAGGWHEVDAAIHGELYLGVLLKRHGVAAPAARKAAAGWDGDMYRGWRSADGRTAFVLATTWDTEKDAAEFFDAYRSTLAKKYEHLTEEKGSDLSSLRYTYGAESLGTGALVMHGLEVFAVEGFAADLRETVVAALVAMKVEHVE